MSLERVLRRTRDGNSWVSPIDGAVLFLLDIVEVVRTFPVQIAGVRRDVQARYRDTFLGVYWSTVTVVIYAIGYSILVGLLFRAPLEDFLPYIVGGALAWQMIAGIVSEAPQMLFSNASLITNGRSNLLEHIFRSCARHLYLFWLGMPVALGVSIIFGLDLRWVPLSILGSLVVMLVLLFGSVWLAFLGVRYPDVTPAVRSLIQFLFYMTPILWRPTMLPDGPPQLLPLLNPFHHLMTVVRGPLIGEPAPLLSYCITGVLLVLAFTGALIFYRTMRKSIELRL